MDINYLKETLKKLLSIHSPLGYYEEIIPFMEQELEKIGYESRKINRGGLLVTFGEGRHVAVSCHLDEIGLSVRKIKDDGKMTLCPIGGIYAKTLNESEGEVVTLDGKKYSATVRHEYPSVHISERDEYSVVLDLYKNMELILDELVYCKEDVEKLGINPGDFVLLDPRTKFLDNGFIKSRFIDNKAGVACVLTALKEINEKKLKINKKITIHFSVYEENGTGGASGIPYDIEEMLAVDIGCVAKDSTAEETKVSIISQDSRSPYSRTMIQKLKKLADKNSIDYTIDVNYPHYGSDTSPAIASGHDIQFGLIGPGTFASHGFERTHIKALENTYKLLLAYLTE